MVVEGASGATVRKGWSWGNGKTRKEEWMAGGREVATGGFEGNGGGGSCSRSPEFEERICKGCQELSII